MNYPRYFIWGNRVYKVYENGDNYFYSKYEDRWLEGSKFFPDDFVNTFCRDSDREITEAEAFLLS